MKKALIVGMCCLFLLSCSEGGGEVTFVPWRIAVSNEEIAQVVRPIVGERALVLPLMFADVDPNTFVVDDEDMSAIANAEMIFYDSDLDPWMDAFLTKADAMADADVAIIMAEDVTVPFSDVPRIDLRDTAYADEIVRALIEFDPDGAAYYRENLLSW